MNESSINCAERRQAFISDALAADFPSRESLLVSLPTLGQFAVLARAVEPGSG